MLSSCCLLLGAMVSLAPAPLADRSSGGQLEHLYRMDFRARKAHEKEFTARTQTYSFDVFIDRKNRRLFHVDPEGKTLAVVEADATLKVRNNKAPRALHRIIVPVRDFEEKELGERTRKISVEVYRDENTQHLIFISESGALAIVPDGKVTKTEVEEKPTWQDRFKLRVRESREATFRNYQCNVEVYHEPRTQQLLYVGDNGALAVFTTKKKGQAGGAVFAYGLILKARRPDQDSFESDIPLFSLEVYRDVSREAWIYITEPLQLIVTSSPITKVDSKRVNEAVWKASLMPQKMARWSGEIYSDANTGLTILATSGKGLAVLPGK